MFSLVEENRSHIENISIIPQVERKVTSYWLDPHISKAFKETCRRLGLHTCNVLEPIMYAFINGMSKAKYFQPIGDLTINLNVNRVVRREDRGFKARDVPLVENGSFSECCNCKSLPVVKATVFEPHQESIRFLCEEHFYEHLDTYVSSKICWKEIRPYYWSHKWKR